MIYYLIGTAACLLTIVFIATLFSKEFPVLDRENKFTLYVCRGLLAIAALCLVASACIQPQFILGESVSDQFPIIYTILAIILSFFAAAVYYIVNLMVLLLFTLLWEYTQKLAKKIFSARSKHSTTKVE